MRRGRRPRGPAEDTSSIPRPSRACSAPPRRPSIAGDHPTLPSLFSSALDTGRLILRWPSLVQPAGIASTNLGNGKLRHHTSSLVCSSSQARSTAPAWRRNTVGELKVKSFKSKCGRL
ncbi:hypothetical protein C2845_PM13G07780 [Panicum miliaceum]|uniref:Uncharacterized protein n=1 Tax=Panicum miliaceum TaxID=4540 RepID=A0A3L6RLW7_PANMI|nr:hypothetical protein C2845_PM13G07780 [Panicum miliaceum]